MTDSPLMTDSELRRALMVDADRCVKCGLCLPHCPTYVESGHEGESPRGRIALLQGLASDLIPLTPAGEAHIDNCLDCRSCESVCPAQVPYGRLLDRGRAWMTSQRPARATAARVVPSLLAGKSWRRLIISAFWIYQRSGLSRLLRAFAPFRHSRAGRLENLLPRLRLPRDPASLLPQAESATATVQLFTGCMGDSVELDAAGALTELLQAAGHRVHIPAQQQCCGALHMHAGLPGKATALLDKNEQAFAGTLPIASLASGCRIGLQDVGRARIQADGGLNLRLRDPFALLNQGRPLAFAPLDAGVALHVPCTQRLTPEGAEPTMQLLRRIPQLRPMRLAVSRSCCGAAGSYLLTQPEMSDRLLEHTLDAIAASGCGLVVSGNVGCRLHIEAGLRRRGLPVEVLHPAVLLQRQLQARD